MLMEVRTSTRLLISTIYQLNSSIEMFVAQDTFTSLVKLRGYLKAPKFTIFVIVTQQQIKHPYSTYFHKAAT
jgi:hypothetical protein